MLEFSLKDAYKFALCAQRAYDLEAVDTHAEIITADNVEVLAQHNSRLILSFRGTEKNVADWLTNIQLSQEEVCACKVHRGFMNAARSIGPKLVYYIKTHPEIPVVLNGHSLGGALAVCFLFWLITEAPEEDRGLRHRIAAVYTYGQPRTGDVYFARFMRRQPTPIYRLVNGPDVVPRLPPRKAYCTQDGIAATLRDRTPGAKGVKLSSVFYRHTQPEIYLGPRSWISIGISWQEREVSNLLLRILNVLRNGLSWNTTGLRSHAMEQYVEKLKPIRIND